MRHLLVRLAVVVGAVALVGGPSAALANPVQTATVAVGGQVAVPTSYSAAQLATLPQTTLPLRGSTTATATGVSLQTVVQAAQPTTPAVKNPILRVSVVVQGLGRKVAFALGELDAGFGNRPALLVTDPSGRVDLVVPGDSTALRTVRGVRSLTVAVAAGTPSTPAPGSVVVTDGARSVTLSAATLAALPARTTTVQLLAAGVPEQHTETGPQLWLVLLVAGVLPGPATTVSAVATDGYLATVTPWEALSGGRALSLSLTEDGVPLAQPRLVVSGDLKGGRYVSGVTDLITSAGW